MRGTLLAVVAFIGVVCLTNPICAQPLEALDGTWEGSLGPAQGPGLTPLTKPMVVRIVISGTKGQVFIRRNGGAMDEVKPGAFRIMRLKSNAIVAAIDSGKDKDGTWVESWDFAVTLKDPTTLIADWYRIVNNVDQPLSVKYRLSGRLVDSLK